MMESEPRPFNQTKSWGELHQHVKDARKLQAKLTNTMVENLLKCSYSYLTTKLRG